jgi:hypothetical protein
VVDRAAHGDDRDGEGEPEATQDDLVECDGRPVPVRVLGHERDHEGEPEDDERKIDPRRLQEPLEGATSPRVPAPEDPEHRDEQDQDADEHVERGRRQREVLRAWTRSRGKRHRSVSGGREERPRRRPVAADESEGEALKVISTRGDLGEP